MKTLMLTATAAILSLPAPDALAALSSDAARPRPMVVDGVRIAKPKPNPDKACITVKTCDAYGVCKIKMTCPDAIRY